MIRTYLYRMEVDYLIVGQGICGTMLSWYLLKEGKTFLVIDDNNENSSSKIAAGIINPVTGRRAQGPVLHREFATFVGRQPISQAHGMTVADLARLFNGEFLTTPGTPRPATPPGQ